MKRFLFTVPILILAAVLIQNTRNSPQVGEANAVASASSSNEATETIDKPVINPIHKATPRQKNRRQANTMIRKKSHAAAASEPFPNRPVSLAAKEGRIRKEVSKEEVDAVIYQGRPADAEGSQSGEQPQPELPANQDERSSPANAGANERWISKLSGESAILNVRNQKNIDCSDSQSKCANLSGRNEVSVVGVLVKSQPDKSSIVPAPMRGEMHTGNQLDDTPAVYVD
jgi:hypothetical protein